MTLVSSSLTRIMTAAVVEPESNQEAYRRDVQKVHSECKAKAMAGVNELMKQSQNTHPNAKNRGTMSSEKTNR